MKDEDKKKKQKKSRHPFDVWPPPRKKGETLEKEGEKLPKNVSYRDPEEYLDSPPEPVYDTETEREKEIEQEEKDEEEEKNDESK